MVRDEGHGGLLAREFESSIVTTITHIAGVAPTIQEAPALITDGAFGHIYITGGWTGMITAHCSAGVIIDLTDKMKMLLLDRTADRELAVVEVLLETVANAFMRKFTIKSDVSTPNAVSWSLARQERIKELKEMWKMSCSLPSGSFSFSLAQGGDLSFGEE